jgi:hypothetical protein
LLRASSGCCRSRPMHLTSWDMGVRTKFHGRLFVICHQVYIFGDGGGSTIVPNRRMWSSLLGANTVVSTLGHFNTCLSNSLIN